jgi:putative ABC transport system permease protein
MEGLTLLLTEPNALILSEGTAARYGLVTGARLPLDIGGRTVQARVVGLLNPADEVTRRALGDILFTDIASAQEMLDMRGRLSYIDLIAGDEESLAPVRALLPPGVTLETAAARQNAVQQMTAAFELNLTALSLLALVVGMFLIYNTVTFSVVQRRPLFGTLRSLGVTGGQLFRLILGESIILSLIGAILGLGLGVLLGRGTVQLITQTINDLYFVVNVESVTVPVMTLVRGVIIGVGAAVLASLLPALEAMQTTPQTTLRRSTLESRARKLLPWLLLAWAVLTLAGVGLLSLRGSLITAFTGLFAVLIGAALLAPPVTAVLMRLTMPISGRLLGVLGRMAPRDISRSLSRTSVAIAALMTAVAVIVGVSIMVGSFRQTVAEWLGQTLQADVFISPLGVTANRTVAGALDPAIVADAMDWPGVERAVTSHAVQLNVPAFGRAVQLVSVNGDVSQGNRPYAWVREGIDDPWPLLEAGEGVIISEALVLKENLAIPPQPLTVPTAVGPRTFPILAVFYDYATDQGSIMVDNDLYQALWDDPTVSAVGLFLGPGQDVDQIVTALQSHFRDRYGQDVLVRSNETLRRSSLEIFDRTFAITSALRLLAVIVAFIGVLSALMSLQLERARELGTLRATGMTREQMWLLILLETGLMGATAGLLAMPVGYVLAWILVYVINVRSFGWTLNMQLEPAYFLQALAVAVVAALLAGIYPALRLSKMEIAAAVREE